VVSFEVFPFLLCLLKSNLYIQIFTTLLEILFVIVIIKTILVHFSSVIIERDFSFSHELDTCMLQVLFCGVNEIINSSIICFSQVSEYISLVLSWNISLCCFIRMYHFQFPHVL
jgi:hypothetical protein